MAIPATQIRKGMILELGGEVLRVHEFTHVTPGKGQAIVQTRLRNLRTGAMIDRRFRSAETVERVQIDQRQMQYLYADGDLYAFMDLETYEEIHMTAATLQEALPYLVENLELRVDLYDDQPIGVELPGTVDLEVVETEPALKGATASASYKPAKTQTGIVVNVPPFIGEGDTIRVDTNAGEYVTRVS